MLNAAGTLLSVHIIRIYVYPEGQKGAAKRAESPEDRLVFYSENLIWRYSLLLFDGKDI